MTETYEQQYKKMTETPVHKLVLSLGLPTTISMLVTNLYNIADTFFVSQIGTSASGATGVVFALMAIIQAFGFMLGHGAGSNLSRRLPPTLRPRDAMPPPAFFSRSSAEALSWRSV